MYEFLLCNCWWGDFLPKIKRFVRNYDICRRIKLARERHQGLLRPVETP